MVIPATGRFCLLAFTPSGFRAPGSDKNTFSRRLRYKAVSALIFFVVGIVSPSFLAVGEEIETWKYLSVGQAVSVKQGWLQTRDNASIIGQGLRVAGRRFQKGLGTHPAGEIVFDLAGKHKVFRTLIGVDDGAPAAGSVVFRVLLDGKQVFDSGKVKHGEKAREVRLDVSGVKELKLICTDAGDGPQGDHADWLEAAVDDFEKTVPKPIPQYSVAGFHPIDGSPRKVWSFNPGWRFFKGECEGAERPDFDDADWEAANLPHGLELMGVNLSGSRNYQGPAWYRKVFEVPEETRNKKTVLYFEAVMGKSRVYVDGELVAEHFGGYLPFAADISKYTQKGGKHVVAVWADNSDDSSIPPGGSQRHLDFTYLGGIYRDVYLIETGPIHITLPELSETVAGGGVFVGVKAAKNLGNHRGDAEIEVRVEFCSKKPVSLRVLVEDAEENVVATKIERPLLNALMDASTSYSFAFDLKDIRLWHPDSPYQHWIRTEILDENGKVLDSMRTRFGIRSFEMRGDKGLYVNGESIGHKLSGVNRHQDYAVVGNAVPNSGQWRDAKRIREGGSTIVRAAHYPLDPAFMDACDQYGLLVAAAVPGWQFYNGHDPLFWKRCVENARNLGRRDRNRPAVLLWETALNETDHQPAKMLTEMHEALHEEIPFPGVFSCTDGNHAKPAGLDFYYHGGMEEPVCSLTREYGDGGEVDNFGSQNAASRVPREWGERAMIRQAMIRYRGLDSIMGTPPKRIGATLWCGIDHQRGYHPDPFWGGLLDSFRIPKYSFHVFKSQYDADFKLDGIETGPMVFIAHELTQISPKDVLIATNCDEVRLTWLGREIGTQKPEPGYEHTPHPPVVFKDAFDFGEIRSKWRNKTNEIEMVAEGLIDGNVVCVQKRKYPQRTSAVRLSLDDCGVGLEADGGDFVPVRATVVDGSGVAKVLASEYITFVVDGAGELLGGAAQNLNPAKTEFGVATTLVRSKTEKGLIRVRAFCPGLPCLEELVIPAADATFPLLYDKTYEKASKRPDSAFRIHVENRESSGNETDLRKEIERLKLEAISREQDLMEMRSKLSGGH